MVFTEFALTIHMSLHGNRKPFHVVHCNHSTIASTISHFSCHGIRNLESGKGGVYYDSIGEDPHRVYAMGMCITGTEKTVCSDCIKVASEQLIENCPNHTEAFTWTPYKTLCFARYSYRPFLTTLDMHPLYTEFNSVDAKPNLTDFEDRWEKLVRPMITKAAFSTKGPAFSDRRYYATDAANSKTSQAIYALMQCTSNLSPYQCNECLEETLNHYEANCRGKQGCSLAFASCFFRWDLYPFSGAFNQKCKKISTGIIMAFVVPTVAIISLLSAAVAVLINRRTNTDPAGESSTTNSLQYDLKTIEAATFTFSKRNMLGKGGFGEVFKAVLPDGSEIAVKRLSKESAQGIQEFKNEASLVAKLQHKNLVRVLGFCMEGEEKILIYEFVPNKSLDYYLFGPTKQGQLDWTKRYEIIVGTAKGILYLHQDAPLKIIHRDLKASNIILDADMKPKIADFGMARILGMDQSRANTRRVVGTYGYIAPECMMHGESSTKSDVYSFGVIILEIISGKRNSSFHETDESGKNLITHAWKHWKDGTPLELVDAELGGNYQSDEVIKCIHIALLCVQNEPEKRRPLSDIIPVLTSNSNSLPLPQSPPYEILEFDLPPINSVHGSANDSLMSDFVPR